MKKILLVSFALFSCLSAYCQSSFGLKGGLNFANIGGDAQGVESRIAFHAGIFGIIRHSDGFAFSPEFVFSRQGAKAEGNNDIKINYDYINIPLMFNLYPAENFFIQAGPQLGAIIGARISDGDNSEDVANQLNSLDLALGIGIGFDLHMHTIGLRYNAGLSNTAKKSNDNQKFPNQVIQISLGFKFR